MALPLLSDRQRAELEDILIHTPLAKERCRAQALLWLTEGADVGEIAELLHVSCQTVYITPARKFRILAHTNPTRQRGL